MARRFELSPTWARYWVPSQNATIPVGLLVTEEVAVTSAENVTFVVDDTVELRVVIVPLA